MSEKLGEEVLEALESMARQHCFTYGPDHSEPNITESQALSANAEALYVLADYGRFRVERSFGRMVIGYWPEHDPRSKGDSERPLLD